MRAIETVYNGLRFRSRLEAKWSIAFDKLGIPYRYESEGYELSDGTFYLPDFHLPTLLMWAEVKGPKPNRSDLHKARLLYQESKMPVLILGQIEDIVIYFGPDCDGVTWHRFWSSLWDFGIVQHALTQARQARFEHGQIGAPEDW